MVLFDYDWREDLRIVGAALAARLRADRAHSIALLGKDGGAAKGLATVELIVPGPVTARIQEAHKFIFHVICELVDPALT